MDAFCEICMKNFPTHRHLVRHQRQLELTALDDVPSPTSSNTLSQKSLSPDICTDCEIYSSSVINPLRKQATLKDDLSTAEELDVCRDFGEKQATFYGGISESDGGGV
ncbi:uncharacterized protein [Ptychodera flava]|uniref:uncharacterized protein n=1 Tax=Ptychodera flava TaxID=63121 RepID=UPI003969E29C